MSGSESSSDQNMDDHIRRYSRETVCKHDTSDSADAFARGSDATMSEGHYQKAGKPSAPLLLDNDTAVPPECGAPLACRGILKRFPAMRAEHAAGSGENYSNLSCSARGQGYGKLAEGEMATIAPTRMPIESLRRGIRGMRGGRGRPRGGRPAATAASEARDEDGWLLERRQGKQIAELAIQNGFGAKRVRRGGANGMKRQPCTDTGPSEPVPDYAREEGDDAGGSSSDS